MKNLFWIGTKPLVSITKLNLSINKNKNYLSYSKNSDLLMPIKLFCVSWLMLTFNKVQPHWVHIHSKISENLCHIFSTIFVAELKWVFPRDWVCWIVFALCLFVWFLLVKMSLVPDLQCLNKISSIHWSLRPSQRVNEHVALLLLLCNTYSKRWLCLSVYRKFQFVDSREMNWRE